MAPKQNPLTSEYFARRHRRQVRLQIWLPIWAAIILVLAVAALAILGTVNRSSEVNRWGNISAILLIIPNLVTSLISMTILFLSVRGLAALYRRIPGWMHRLLSIFQSLQAFVRKMADKAAAPVLSVNAAGASLGAVRRKFSRKQQTRSS